MKKSGLKNRFNPRVRELYTFWYQCFWCGENQYDCLHHIISPSSNGWKIGKHNTSPLNAAPMHNFSCHLDNGQLHSNDIERKLLIKAMRFLRSIDYKFTDNDKEFFNKYKDTHYDIRNRPWS